MNRELVALFCAATFACGACGGGRAVDAPKAGPAAKANVRIGDAGVGDDLVSFDVLAARATEEAPLMREIARVSGSWELRAEEGVCVRAVFAARGSVRVVFVDDEGALRGDAAEGASGVAPAGGPACFRKGERVRLAVSSESMGAVRIVVLRAP